MSNVASAANETIKVATDRYVVLDDPAAGTASTNFVNPNSADYTSNIWDGKQTTIGVKTLFIDSNGTPLTGRTVNFTIYRPGGTYATGTNLTDSNGVSSFYKDLNGANFWGNWTVRAESGGVYQNTTFIYNWWGCAWSSGGCQGQHSGQNRASAGTQATANSPYTYSSERVTGLRTDHNLDISLNGWAGDYCTVCHQNYDGNPTTSNAGGGPAKDFTTTDTHRNIR
ncbi:MAG: hypothetical protein PHH85_05265, partial [Candidatus Methanoperedens sp.]|nr:hypothetical protein [Candidatus Methanoperedens sp.]